MPQQTTYQKYSLKKIFFALAFLISLSPPTGYINYITASARQKTKIELVVSYKAKTPNWIKSLYKKVNVKAFTKSPALIKYESVFLQAYNNLTEVRFEDLSRKYSLIKSYSTLLRVKAILRSSKENNFISFAG